MRPPETPFYRKTLNQTRERSPEIFLSRFSHLFSFERPRVPEPRSGALRLHRNEKIDDWPEEFRELIFGSLPDNLLQCYPNHRPFYEKLSKFLGLAESRFVVTSGIDEAAKALLTLCCEPEDHYAAVWPGYAMYKVYGQMLGAKMTPIMYDPNHFMTPDELLSMLPDGCKVVFLPNPSQPVENYFPPDQLRQIAAGCHERGFLLAVDEAYHFFGSESAIPLTDEFDNVLVLRTFSKAFGAGCLRLGYAVGSETGLAPLSAFRLAHEANALTYHVGSMLLEHFDDYVAKSIEDVRAGRDFFREQCRAYGLQAWGEVGNFVLVDFETKERAGRVVEGLDSRDILVRGLTHNLERYIMVTSGPVDTMGKVFEAVRAILENDNP